ncbi:MAG TPA: DNA adenine methylase [Pyrinomonadaceae bacterium]
MARSATQMVLFETKALTHIINVAAVPQRSPFRYPGGKTWLVPRIRQWLKKRPAHFIEPFAGGAIVGLTVGAEDLADHVTMVECDEQVASVWKVIIEGESDAIWLAETIVMFNLTDETLAEVLTSKPGTLREKAFQTVLKNRTFHGGILAAGSSPLKHGENGRGIRSRWYAETLKRRILDIVEYRDKITFVQGDGIEVMRKNSRKGDAAFFIDPPYTAGGKRAGRRLYTYSELDHDKLFKVTSKVEGDFLMTYDDAEDVRELAKSYNFDTELVAMKNTHHASMKELLIGRDLDWARL